MSDQDNSVPDVTDGGIAFRYPPRPDMPTFAVAPSIVGEEPVTNVVAPPWGPEPTGCVRLDHNRFAFDSSFPRASLSNEVDRLFAMRDPADTENEWLAIFGHADPTGEEPHNKKLAGRRAKAVYALLTRQPELWEELHQGALGKDAWGIESLHACLSHLGYEPGQDNKRHTPSFSSAVKAFQRDRGLRDSGQVDKATRLELFSAYIDALTAGPDGEPRRYAATDFVGDGKLDELRGAVQGCGERNPTLVLSDEDNRRLSQESAKEERNRVLAVNRRVVIFVFPKKDFLQRKGAENFAQWRCPSAAAGPDGCAKAAWSDKEERLRPGEQQRESGRGGKTFGCKFYDWLARLSPCEALKGTAKIWLLDEYHRRMPKARYRLQIANSIRVGTALADSSPGLAIEREVPLGFPATIAWGEAEKEETGDDGLEPSFRAALQAGQFPESRGLLREPSYRYRRNLNLAAENIADPKTSDRWRLQHLGFSPSADLTQAMEGFHATYGQGQQVGPVHRQGLEGTRAERETESERALAQNDPIATDAGSAPEAPPPTASDAGAPAEPTAPSEAKGGDGAPTQAKGTEGTVTTAGIPCTCPDVIRDEIAAVLAKPADPNNVANFRLPRILEPPVLEPGTKSDSPEAKRDAEQSFTVQLYKITFLGKPCQDTMKKQNGVSKNFATKLHGIQQRLFDKYIRSPDRKTCSVQDFYTWTGVTDGHSGIRDGMSDLHSSGSAIDINGGTNPWFPVRLADGKFGGEPHSAGLDIVVGLDKDGGVKPTEVGKRALDKFGIATKSADGKRVRPAGEVARSLGHALSEECVWKPCIAIADRAWQLYVDQSGRPEIGPLSGAGSRADAYKKAYVNWAGASAAVVHWLELRFGRLTTRSIPAGQKVKRTETSVDQAFEIAIEQRLLGFIDNRSALGQVLSKIDPVADPADMGSPAKKNDLAKLVQDKLKTLDSNSKGRIEELRADAGKAHEILRRGIVQGKVSWFGSQAAALAACKGEPTVFPVPGVEGLFGAVPAWRDPRAGFIRLRWELVETFAEEPDLRWGATDFFMESGDVMHFDFGRQDPGPQTSDPALAKWRAWQNERRAAVSAWTKLEASETSISKELVATDAAAKIAKAKVLPFKKDAARADLGDRLDQLASRVAKGGDLQNRIEALRKSTHDHGLSERHGVWKEEEKAKQHRELVEKDGAKMGRVEGIAKRLHAVSFAGAITAISKVKANQQDTRIPAEDRLTELKAQLNGIEKELATEETP